jgi:riboflavin synthase
MFTGIIEGKGKILRVEYLGNVRRLTIVFPAHLTEVQLGDSISINGVCLTIMEKRVQAFKFDLSEETLRNSALGELREGDPVNLERALRLNDRLGGHFVTGHIDGVGVITEKKRERDFVNLRVKVPDAVSEYVVSKGSIAIDGISLTVNECRGKEILITLIPYTLEKTTLMEKRAGDRVNLEADILGKYVGRLLNRKEGKPEGLDRSFLKEHGFLKGDEGYDG